MSLINISNLSFYYDGSYENIFEKVSFQIDTDWKLGLVGRNGRGKTTFLNLLMKKFSYTGTITSNVEFEYFPYQVEDKELTTIEIIDSILFEYQEWRLIRELHLLDMADEVLYRPFVTLSNGEQTKVLLATLFLKDNCFLLIDEPTNHLDMAAREIVSLYLNKKKGFILVSHDRAFMDNCIDHILSINKVNIEIQKGNYSSWSQNKEVQDQFEINTNNRLKKDIKHLETASKRTSEWSNKVEASKIGFSSSHEKTEAGTRAYIGSKSAKMMKRAKTMENRKEASIEEKSKLLKNIETSEQLKLFPLKYHFERLIEFENLTIRYDDRIVCKNINFSIRRGERIALQGKNGSEKSSIIKLICGENIFYEGNMLKEKGIKISYVSQDTSMLEGNLSDYAKKYKVDESLFKAILRKLDFSRAQFEKNMKDFSEGQKKKVLISRSLCEQAHLYLWDEPLNYIDVISRKQIEALIKEYEPTLLFVEHDRIFSETIATKFVELSL